MEGDEPISPNENWPCGVGSGECSRPACVRLNDGRGDYFYICEQHCAEFSAICEVVGAMTEEQREVFERAIERHS